MRRTKTLDIYLKEVGMNYHCNTCGTTKRTAQAMDRHIIRCEKKTRKTNAKRRNQK